MILLPIKNSFILVFRLLSDHYAGPHYYKVGIAMAFQQSDSFCSIKQSYERQYYGRLRRNNWRPKKYLEMDSYFKSKNSIVWRSDRGTGDKVFQRTRPVQGFRSTVWNRWKQPQSFSRPINTPNVRILYRDTSVQDPIKFIRQQIVRMKIFNWAR